MANFDEPAVNPGKNFLSAKVTSPFLKQHKSAAVDAVVNNLYKVVEDGLRIVSNPGAQGPQIDGDLIDSDMLNKLNEFASGAVESLSKTATDAAKKVVDDFMGKIKKDIANIPTDVLAKAAKDAVGNVQDMIKEAIEKQIIPNEIRVEALAKLMQQNTFTQIIDDINKKVSDVMKFANEQKDLAMTRVSLMLQYVEQGPKFIEDQLQKQGDCAMAAIQSTLEAQYNQIKKSIDVWKDGMAETVAQKLINDIKEKIFEEQKVIFDNVRKATLVIKTKAHELLQTAKLQIMAMLGVNLPID